MSTRREVGGTGRTALRDSNCQRELVVTVPPPSPWSAILPDLAAYAFLLSCALCVREPRVEKAIRPSIKVELERDSYVVLSRHALRIYTACSQSVLYLRLNVFFLVCLSIPSGVAYPQHIHGKNVAPIQAAHRPFLLRATTCPLLPIFNVVSGRYGEVANV